MFVNLTFTSDGTRRGAALIIVLAGVVIVATVILVFFSQATLGRRISVTSAGQQQAERVARAGMQTVIADLKSEIIAGSTATTTALITHYEPTSRTTQLPQRVGDNGLANLLKKSVAGQAFWSGSDYATSVTAPVRAATGHSTSLPSANSRTVEASRWNAPYLLGATLPATFTVPDWVVVTRRGAIADATAMPALAALADRDVANDDYAIGRFAYTVYHQGGLLDVNHAGYPSPASADFTGRKGFLQQVDLGAIPGVLDADALVRWRHAASVADYPGYLFANQDGFSRVLPGNQTFVTRQDLIRYAKEHPAQLGLNALEYLATFTRDRNAPSHIPNLARPVVGSGSPGARVDDRFNPSLINTRVTATFIREDGSTARVGEPLIKQRFPLSRLALLTRTATAAVGSPIHRYFGLTRSSASDPWVYSHGSADRILTLGEVATAAREPDFFELLQAGMHYGSLGKTAGDGNSVVSPLDGNIHYQVIQVGANLIDQYDDDSYPVSLNFNSTLFYGIEDLPYLMQVFETAYRRMDPAISPSQRSHEVGVWYQPRIWNPHRPALTGSGGPTSFRYIVTGEARAAVSGWGTPGYAGSLISYSPPNTFDNPAGVTFSLSATQTFREPALLTPANANAPAGAPDRMLDGGSADFLGIWVGYSNAPDQWLHAPNNVFYQFSYVQPGPYVDHLLQYHDGSDWVTYDVIRNVSKGASSTDDKFFTEPIPKTFMVRGDPRSDRFGVGASADGPSYNGSLTVRVNEEDGYKAWGLNAASGWTYIMEGTSLALYSGLLAENKASSTTRYTDPDGVQRRGDGAYTTGTLGDGGYPLAPGADDSRPLVLNRPFRSIAEMGYASRGMPWKSLDFFSQESGDAALLDLFMLQEAPEVIHGVVDLNTRQTPVLAALLNGALRSEDGSATLSPGEATAFASALVAFTSGTTSPQGPLANRADLVARWIGTLPATGPDEIIKRRREAAARTLSDVGTTRTWNLLIDIIAQSGRYAPGAASLEKFTVQGERRYWLHLAMDRYTGEVIAEYLEPVYE